MTHDAGARCLCVAEHRPAPLEYVEHHVWPSGMGGPDVAANRIWICDTTHRNAHELLRLFLRDHRIWSWGEVGDLYTQPVSRYAYRVAAVGFRAVTTRTVTPVDAVSGA